MTTVTKTNHQISENASEITLVYPAKQGGELVTEFKFERSEHDGIPRDSIYSVPKNAISTSNSQLAGYFNIDFKKEDEFDFKILGGRHSSDSPKQGRCYAIGVHVKPGSKSTQHIAKEYPKHPTTPKFYNEAKFGEISELPDLNNKTFGLRLVSYKTSRNTMKAECYVDLSVLDQSISELKESGTVPNNWQLFYTCEDDGTWKNSHGDKGGEPYLKNQGKENGGDAMGFYIRIDNIDKKTQYAFLQGVEIIPPN